MAMANSFIDELTREAETTRRVLERVPQDKLTWRPHAKSWSLTGGGNTILALPRIAMVRSIMLNQWYHHRGQLSVYLRLFDISVPSIYGPSADENPFG
jgi:hypothetical protein